MHINKINKKQHITIDCIVTVKTQGANIQHQIIRDRLNCNQQFLFSDLIP